MICESRSQDQLLAALASIVSDCQQSNGMLNRNSFRFSLKLLKVIVWVAQGVSLKKIFFKEKENIESRREWVMWGKHQCVSALPSRTQRPEGPIGARLLAWFR